jgi:hypothetical protein
VLWFFGHALGLRQTGSRLFPIRRRSVERLPDGITNVWGVPHLLEDHPVQLGHTIIDDPFVAREISILFTVRPE